MFDEVVDVLMKVGRGECAVADIGQIHGNDLWCQIGNYEADGWRLDVYWDCFTMKYIDHVVSPDGRAATFDDLWQENDKGGISPYESIWSRDPDAYDAIEKAFQSASHFYPPEQKGQEITGMFNIETLIGVEDLDNEKRMKRHRDSLDGGAKAHSSRSKFKSEEITPYVIQTRKSGATESLPETAETRKYRVLRRFYE